MFEEGEGTLMNIRRATILFVTIIMFAGLGLITSRSLAANPAGKDHTLAPETFQLENVSTALSSPVFVTNANDGSNRLFVVEQAGSIQVLQPGATTPTVFLN